MTSEKDEKFLAQWEAQLGQPRWRFYLRYTLVWASFMFFVTLLIDWLRGRLELSPASVIIRFFAVILGGVFYALYLRYITDRRVRRIQNELKESGPLPQA